MLSAAALALSTAALVPLVSAQDATPDASTGMTGTGISCDAATTLLAVLAQRDYGFVAPTGFSSTFSLGQFQNYGMSGAGMDSTGMTGMDTTGMDTTGMSGTDSTGMSGMDTTGTASGSTDASGASATQDASMMGGSMLTDSAITGEDPQCASLRASVIQFFTQQPRSAMGMNGSMGGTSMGTDTMGGTGMGTDTTGGMGTDTTGSMGTGMDTTGGASATAAASG